MANFALALAVSIPASPQGVDLKAIVQKSVDIDFRNYELARNYTMTEHTVTREFESDGKVSSTKNTTKEKGFLYGQPYSKLIEKDGKPLSPGEAKKEQERIEKLAAKRAGESEADLRKRIAQEEKRRREQRAFLREIPEAFDFTAQPDEVIEGRPIWVIDAKPRPDYRPKLSEAAILKKFQGRLWIDKSDFHWVKTECESIDTVSFGLILARLQKGAKISFEQTRLNDELWLPKTFRIRFDARLALFKHARLEVDQTFSNYKKFQTDSRIVSVGAQ